MKKLKLENLKITFYVFNEDTYRYLLLDTYIDVSNDYHEMIFFDSKADFTIPGVHPGFLYFLRKQKF